MLFSSIIGVVTDYETYFELADVLNGHAMESLVCPSMILWPFCLALLGLEGCGSSSFTFDFHTM